MTAISANLDENHTHKLNNLVQLTDASIDEIIERAIDVYYAQTLSVEPPSSREILKRSGFIGCGEAEPDLSENYKSYLTVSLEQKYDHR
jgi:hypothetical protein